MLQKSNSNSTVLPMATSFLLSAKDVGVKDLAREGGQDRREQKYWEKDEKTKKDIKDKTL